MKPHCLLVSLCLLGLAAPPIRAATPAEELLRFVPPDVSFCLVLRDLRAHATALGKSPFAEQVRESPLGKALKDLPELQKLEKAEQFLENVLGIKLDQIRDDILGESIVFAYRPGPPGKPEQEQGVVLLRARQARPLADLVEKLNKVLKDTAMLKEVQEIEHNGFKYQRRTEGKEVNYLYLRGPILIFTGQEALLREALALEKRTPATEESAVGKSLRQLGAEKSLAATWINPRAFDAALAARLEKSAGDEKPFLSTFTTCWKALDAVAFTMSLTRDLELGLTLRGRPETLPLAVRRFLDDTAGAAEVWSRFPDDALLAFGARTPAAGFLAFLGSFQTKETFEALQKELNRGDLGASLGKDLVTEVLPHIGPDWGVCISAPARAEKPWFPGMLFALRVATGDSVDPVDKAVVSVLDSYARIAVLGFNKLRKDKERLILKTLKDRPEVRYLASERGQLMGFQPAFGLCDGYLLIASTPETIHRFVNKAKGAKVPSGSEVPLLRISFSNVRQYLKDRRQPLCTALAEQHKLTPKQVEQQLDTVTDGLGLFDRLELVQRTIPGQVTYTLRLRPMQPFRK